MIESVEPPWLIPFADESYKNFVPLPRRHGDTALMCLSASQIIYSFIMMPSTLPPSYIRFLNKQAAKEPWVWKAVQV